MSEGFPSCVVLPESLRYHCCMKRPAFKKNKSSLRKQKQQSLTQTPAMRRLIARQKKLLLSLAGIGSSGFGDISTAHDAYLNETRH
jgi:hypothetical protein